MRSVLIVLLVVLCQIRRGNLAKLERKEYQIEMDHHRSARVHRVADREFPGSGESDVKSTINNLMATQIVVLGNEELSKLLNDFPNLSSLLQHEAQLYKELIVILSDLVRNGTVTLKNIDRVISEIKDGDVSSKSILNTDNDSRKNLLNSLEDLDVYQRSNENTPRNGTRSLDNVLIQIQKHLAFVRRVFQRLCRKHNSSNVNNSGILAPTNQPKKVSIL